MRLAAALFAELTDRARECGRAAEARLEGADENTAARSALGLLRDAGLTAWTVPNAFGGADTRGLCAREAVSTRVLCALRDELAWHSGMLDVIFVMQGLGSYPIAFAGSAALKAEVLPTVAQGRRIAAFALTEPGGGSSLKDTATTAVKKGTSWRLDGKKAFISNAGIADHYCVLARTAGEPGNPEGLTMFHVSARSRGIDVKRYEMMSPHPIGDITFTDVDVPDGHRLGVEGSGLQLAIATLERFRPTVAAAANGFARRAFDESRARLSARRQFGKPLAAYQTMRFDLAEMDMRLRAAQLLVDEAAQIVDEDGYATMAVARAKLFATENAGWICDRAVQHFGGMGVRRGSVVERLYRDVRALRIYEGTSEIQKLVLAKEILKV